MPPHFCQLVSLFLVPHLVALYFRFPEICVALGYHETAAALMTVPEATVDKDDSPVLAHHYVGVSRQSRMVEPISETTSKQVLAHHYFRLRPLASDGCHTLVALFFCHPVH